MTLIITLNVDVINRSDAHLSLLRSRLYKQASIIILLYWGVLDFDL